MTNEEKNNLEPQEEVTSKTEAAAEGSMEEIQSQSAELEANRKKAMAALGLLDEPANAQPEEIPVVEQEVTVEVAEATSAKPVAKASAQPEVESSKQEATHADDEDQEDDAEDAHYDQFSLDQLLAAAQELKETTQLGKAEKRLKKMREFVQKIRNELKEESRANYVAANGSEEGFEFQNPSQVDEFFTIFKSIRENRQKHFEKMTLDRQNNLKGKWAIVENIKELTEAIDQKGSLEKVKQLQKKFKEIGPVPATDAEDLYRSYEAVLDIFYDNKSIEFDLKELDRKKNLETKLEICDRAEKLIEMEDVKEAAIQLNALHDEFKSVGPVPREGQEIVWQRFKTASDTVYDKRRELAEQFKLELKRNMETKQQLCLLVEPFAQFQSDRIKEWNEKTKELQALQKDWDKVGPLPREVAKDINRQFWANFKLFFSNKGKFFEQLENTRKENLKAKEALCEQAEILKESDDWKEATDKLIELQKQWKEVGPVPEKQREPIYQRFKAACDFFFERRRSQRKNQDSQYVDNLKAKDKICAAMVADAKKKTFDMATLEAYKKDFFAIGFVPRKNMDDILEKFITASDVYLENSPLTGDEKERQKLEFQSDLFKDAPRAAMKFRKKEQNLRQKISQLENDIALWENNLEFFANSKTADKLREDFQKKVKAAQKEIKEMKEQLAIISNVNY